MNLFTFAKQIPPLLTAKLWRAVIEFQLIQPNDRVAIGFSGGKDSIFLLFLLAALKEKFPFSFDLHALHIDNGFAPAEEGEHMRAELTRYCEEIGIPFTSIGSQWKKFGSQKTENHLASSAQGIGEGL